MRKKVRELEEERKILRKAAKEPGMTSRADPTFSKGATLHNLTRLPQFSFFALHGTPSMQVAMSPQGARRPLVFFHRLPMKLPRLIPPTLGWNTPKAATPAPLRIAQEARGGHVEKNR